MAGAAGRADIQAITIRAATPTAVIPTGRASPEPANPTGQASPEPVNPTGQASPEPVNPTGQASPASANPTGQASPAAANPAASLLWPARLAAVIPAEGVRAAAAGTTVLSGGRVSQGPRPPNPGGAFGAARCIVKELPSCAK
jgi:hypothetical protein